MKNQIMVYEDKVYGRTEIEEPVILELINSPELQRLKEVDQAGYFEPYYPGSKHTRFEHSLGVYLLLRKFGAPIEEQIAGLIHDVSHSAFSHAVDYVLSEGSEKEQSHQDNYFDEYVLASGIPSILKKYGFETGYILDETNFPLLETQLPDLCADRIDYSLRGLLAYGVVGAEEVGNILKKLMVQDRRWVFADFDSAYGFAGLFKVLNAEYYSGIKTAVMFRRLGDYLRYALQQGHITKEDLYTTDAAVLAKLNGNLADDPELDRLWRKLNDGGGYENDPDNYDAEVYCKSRIIDPLCRHNGEIRKVSDIEPDWKNVVKRESEPKKHRIRY